MCAEEAPFLELYDVQVRSAAHEHAVRKDGFCELPDLQIKYAREDIGAALRLLAGQQRAENLASPRIAGGREKEVRLPICPNCSHRALVPPARVARPPCEGGRQNDALARASVLGVGLVVVHGNRVAQVVKDGGAGISLIVAAPL